MLRTKIKISVILCLMACSCYSQLIPIRNKVQGGYNFWINIPSGYNSKGESVPILFFLHGRSLSGKNLDRVKKYGVVREIIGNRKIPAIVVAPQCPSGQSWNPDKLLKILEYVQRNYNTDTNRIYFTGMSLGGYGVLFFAGKYASKITAAVAMCGGGNVRDACNLNTIPLWIMHGKQDRAVPFSESAIMVDAIRQCGGCLLKFTEYEDLGHKELAQCFAFNEMYDWLFHYSRATATDTIQDTIVIPESKYKWRRSSPARKKLISSRETQSKMYIIRNGDTLSRIAKKNGTTVPAICNLNSIKPNTKLKIGRKILLP